MIHECTIEIVQNPFCYPRYVLSVCANSKVLFTFTDANVNVNVKFVFYC